MKINKKNYWTEIPILNKYLRQILLSNRLKIFDIFKKKIYYNKITKILDVGTTPVISEEENILFNHYPWIENITGFSNQNCNNLKNKFKKNKFIIGDARKINLPENSYDIIHCSATIEHVGNSVHQKKMISELYRICKRQIFLTTPNRNFPIEFHTKIPFLHLLPKKIFRKILKIINLKYFALEENLNLLNTKDIEKFCNELGIKNYEICYNKLLFLNSNIILIINKNHES